MGTWTTTPRTWVAGEIPTAAMFNSNLRDFGRAFSDAWTSYTPTLTASTTNPTNWTATGYYSQIGKIVVCRWSIVAGASVTAGSGTYRIALPVNANTTIQIGPGMAYCFDTSAANIAHPRLSIDAATYVTMWYNATWPSGANTPVSGTAPFTWANGDSIVGALLYEAA